MFPYPTSWARTILVADDNPTIRKMLCRMFEIEGNYDLCTEAENGKQAVELALRHRPDLIILHLSMPVMNGLEAAHELKKLMPHVPIILFTQHVDLGDRMRYEHRCGQNRVQKRGFVSDGPHSRTGSRCVESVCHTIGAR